MRWTDAGYAVVRVVEPGMHARLEPFDAVELDVTLLFGDVEPPQPGTP